MEARETGSGCRSWTARGWVGGPCKWQPGAVMANAAEAVARTEEEREDGGGTERNTWDGGGEGGSGIVAEKGVYLGDLRGEEKEATA